MSWWIFVESLIGEHLIHVPGGLKQETLKVPLTAAESEILFEAIEGETVKAHKFTFSNSHFLFPVKDISLTIGCPWADAPLLHFLDEVVKTLVLLLVLWFVIKY